MWILLFPKLLAIDLCVIVIVVGVHHDGLLGLLVVNLLPELSRDTHPERIRLNHSVFWNYRAGGDDAAFADFGIVQDHAAHADEAAVADGAAVQSNGVAHGDIVAHDHAIFVAHAVEHAAILHAAVLADADGIDVTADHGIHPYTGVLADFHVADDLGGLVDIAAIVNAWRFSLVSAQHS